MNDTKNLILVYRDKHGGLHEQRVDDLVNVGTLIDPDDGEAMPLVGWRVVE